MKTTASYPNDLMLLITEDDPTVPEVDRVADIWQSESMLALAVQHDVEGDVELQITNETPSTSSMTLLFHGILPTGRRLVEIQTVYLDRITGIRTLTEELPLRIWGDEPRQPELRPRRRRFDGKLVGPYCFKAAVFFDLRPIRNHVNAPMTGNANTINAQTTWLPVV
ncbi:hypothetical protein J2W14_003117 [Pseudarthrobacter oxydans]|uniref:hypothetical protein n=1 Tax=Pseudarthrobacter oxydans TaxID=1671 RepID=UPI002789D4A1|nr:hypothetical protein [Pseudarthrobacter oxydans]MDP9983694.1 hypothetical protein [Pseudarthrobacter oxydans]